MAAQKSHAAVLEICEEVEHFIIVDDPESTGIYYLEFLIVLLRGMLGSDIILIYFQAVSKPVSKGFPDTARLRNQASQAAKQLADLHASVTYAQNSHQKTDVSRFKKVFMFNVFDFFFKLFSSRQREALVDKIPNLAVLEAKMRTKASAVTTTG